MRPSAAAEIDIRAGASWLASVSDADRLLLLAALLSRFNHDVRTPLNTVSGWSFLLQQEAVEPARRRHGADVIARNGREQMTMLDAFVEDARSVIGRPPADPATASLDDVVAQAFPAAGEEEPSPGSPRIRNETSGAMIACDERLLQRLIKRLALACSRQTDNKATIDLQISRQNEGITVSLTIPTDNADWSDSDLLELRIGTLTAAAFGGSLELLAGAGSSSIRLQLPEAPQAN